jgi:diguanylate cyclase (GGDEF)-like protein
VRQSVLAANAEGAPLPAGKRFKTVNDRFTHSTGDRVLKTIAAIMSSEVRENDLPARWAGDEFVILFDGATELTARQVCERIKIAVASFDWHSVAPGLAMSVTIGLSEVAANDTAESALHRSDESMYRAKPNERNPTPVRTTFQ